MKKIRAFYDFILFDSPPVLAFTDTALLATLVDGVVLVINVGQVTQNDAIRAKRELEKAGAKILGTVLNHFNDQYDIGYHPYAYAYVMRR